MKRYPSVSLRWRTRRYILQNLTSRMRLHRIASPLSSRAWVAQTRHSCCVEKPSPACARPWRYRLVRLDHENRRGHQCEANVTWPICNFWWGLRLLHCGERGSASLTATYKFCKSSVLGSSHVRRRRWCIVWREPYRSVRSNSPIEVRVRVGICKPYRY